MTKCIKGEQFGKLLIVGSKGRYRGATRWICQCECGSMTSVRNDHLTSGKIVSCGCWRSARTSSRNYRHGQSNSPEHKIWQGIIRRCTNKKNPAYKHYGGRGIKVCPEWRRDFTAFLRDVGKRPSPEHSLERKENDGPYSKLNCRWATKIDQANNRRNNVKVTIGTKTMNVSQWKREMGLEGQTLTGKALRAIVDYCSRNIAVALSVHNPEENVYE